jgi:hypothetical protein
MFGRQNLVLILNLTAGRDYPWATLSFYTVTGYHWLSFVKDLHIINLAVIAVILNQNDGVAHG